MVVVVVVVVVVCGGGGGDASALACVELHAPVCACVGSCRLGATRYVLSLVLAALCSFALILTGPRSPSVLVRARVGSYRLGAVLVRAH